jgi:hypothetical protein
MPGKMILSILTIGLIFISGCSSSSQYQTVSPAHTTSTTAFTQIPTKTTSVTSGITAVCDCSKDRYNCDNFSTSSAAQACYDYCMSQGKGDIHRLDADNDKKVCEK